jgi:hypothetical protein
MPGATEIGFSFEDHVIVQAEPVELDTGPHTAEPGTDHHGVVSRCHAETSCCSLNASSQNDISFRL